MLKSGKADFIEWTGDTLLRRDLSKGEVIWDAERPETDSDSGRDSFAWMRRLAMIPRNNDERPGTLVQPAPDLNGDGTGDIVMAFTRTPSLLAVSGRNGARLWSYSAAVNGLGGPDPLGPDELDKALEEAGKAGSKKSLPAVKGGRVIGSPILVQADGDGIPDLLALFFVFEDLNGSAFAFGAGGSVTHFENKHLGRRVMAAISGRTGRPLWARTLDQETMSRPWLWDRLSRWSATHLPFDAFDSQVAVMPGRKGPIVAQVVGSQWTELDPATGQPRGQPIDFGFVPGRPVQHADLDGDGAPEVLALGAGKDGLAAFSSATGRQLWSEEVMARVPSQPAIPPQKWPSVEDLDGDGRAEVVIPDLRALPGGNGTLYQGLRLLDGATGQALDPLHAASNGLARRLLGTPARRARSRRRRHPRPRGGLALPRPEPRRILHGAAARSDAQVYVNALSGKDGHPLWWWHEDVTDYAEPHLWAPSWWGRGPDGWPMLVVPLGGKVPGGSNPVSPQDHPMPPVTRLLEASTGRTLHTIDGLSWPKRADLDGDGLEDLWGSVNGKLRAFRRAAGGLAKPRRFGSHQRSRRRWHRQRHDGRAGHPIQLRQGQGRPTHGHSSLGPRRPATVDLVARQRDKVRSTGGPGSVPAWAHARLSRPSHSPVATSTAMGRRTW